MKASEKHLTASIWLVSEEKPLRVLLLFHKKHQVWLYPGGHVELNENPVEAVTREVKEETGIDIRSFLPLVPIPQSTCHLIPLPRFIMEQKIDRYQEQPAHYHIDLIYRIVLPYREIKPEDHESQRVGWFTLEETEKLPMFENTRYILGKVFRS